MVASMISSALSFFLAYFYVSISCIARYTSNDPISFCHFLLFWQKSTRETFLKSSRYNLQNPSKF